MTRQTKNPMNSRCGLEDCDCGYVIDRLRDLLLEVWNSVPADYRGPDAARHTNALMRIVPTLEDITWPTPTPSSKHSE